MRTKLFLCSFASIVIAGLSYSSANAHEIKGGVMRNMLTKAALPNVPDHNMVALTVELEPSNISPPHKHDAFTFVYVLEGNVRSQLGYDKPVDYVAGQSWTEAPNVIHASTQNLSETEHAKILVVFLAKNGAKLTTSGKLVD